MVTDGETNTQKYKDTFGNPIKEGVYLENRDISKVRYVFQNYHGEWVWEDENSIIMDLSPIQFKNLGIVSFPEEVKKLREIFSKKTRFIKRIEKSLEQLAQSKQHPFNEWGKEPLPFP